MPVAARMTKGRFTALWERCTVDSDATAHLSIYGELVRRYSEPHRHYHTTAHIDHCLVQLDLAAELMDSPDAVEMGLWFHDAIYDPGAADNELRSAELFNALSGDHVDPGFKRSVWDLIMVTAHPEHPKCLDEQYMVDIDLSSFGLPWEAFRSDSEAVRKEYAHQSDARFFAGQIRFLNALLARPSFFFTEFFRARYEATARANIAGYLKELSGRGYK